MLASEFVVVDTDVYSSLFIDPAGAERRGLPLHIWRRTLQGRRVIISFQSRAEVLAGLAMSKWGKERLEQARATLIATHTIHAEPTVIDAFATLTAACRAEGHGLQAKVHNADRWIAACSIAKSLPLLSGDQIYTNAPGLILLPQEQH
ncbi:MAG: PIN domain-containing protein [Leucobacter sp.]